MDINQGLTYEEFLQELEELKQWISRKPRSRRSWYMSAVDYFEGRR